MLLESMITIALITVIMGAVGAEYVSGISVSSGMRAQTVGVQLANSQMDQIRALHPSDLLTGRNQCAVDNERADVAKFTTVGAATLEAYDSTVANGTSTNCPATGTTFSTAPTTATIGSTIYTVYRYFECTATPTPASGSCVTAWPQQSTIASNNIRAVVLVTWPQRGCPSITSVTGNTSGPTCSYATSTVINDDGDLTFDLNQPLPAAPVVNTIASSCPSSQQDCATVAVGDTVSYAMGVQTDTGVAPYTWAVTSGTLPSGLTIDIYGNITGTVSGSTGTFTTTITVTDGFARTASDTITWTVEPQLTFTFTDQTTSTGTNVSKSVAAEASGGGSSSYTFSDPNTTLPTGLSISNAGLITGTPTTAKTYAVSLTVTDAQACPVCASTPRTATAEFNWTVSAGPLTPSKPSNQKWTVSTPLNSSTQVQMSATGGDAKYVWSASGLPTGVTINSSTGLISGTPPATTGTGTATITVSDPTSTGTSPANSTFTWTDYARPTLTSPGNQTNSVGGTVSVDMKPACPNSACTYALTGAPSNLAISSSGVITGTVGGSAKTYNSVQVVVTDSAGATASKTFSWTVLAAPTVGALGTQSFTETGIESVPVTYTCPTSSCKLTLTGSIPGLGLTTSATATGNLSTNTSLTVSSATGTVYVGGTVQTTAVTGSATSATYNPVVTIAAMSDSASAATAQVTWTAYTVPTVTSPGNLTSASYATVQEAISSSCSNTPCSFTLANAPAGLTMNNSTGAISGTITSGAQSFSSVTISVTDADSVAATVTFKWTVTAATNNLASFFNNVGVTADNNTNTGNFDGANGSSNAGDSFSATALAAATPNALTAGSEVNFNGLNFTWPATAGTGQPDNVLAYGQTISITGNGSTLGFLLSGDYGSPSGSGTITYADGTTQSYTLASPDWWGAKVATSVANASYLNTPNNGRQTQSVNVYYAGVSLNYPGKSVASVTLPTVARQVNTNVAAMHIFAMSLTAASLASSFNNVGVTADTSSTTRGYGNFDGSNDSYSKTALSNAGVTAGNTYTTQGIGFTWPSTATGASTTSYDNTLASGQTVNYSGSGTTLGFLLSSSVAATSGTGTIIYTDGTQQSFTIAAPLWSSNTGSQVISTSYYNKTSASTTASRYVFYASVSLASGKAIDDIHLPNITASPGNSTGAMHVFAIGVK